MLICKFAQFYTGGIECLTVSAGSKHWKIEFDPTGQQPQKE